MHSDRRFRGWKEAGDIDTDLHQDVEEVKIGRSRKLPLALYVQGYVKAVGAKTTVFCILNTVFCISA